MVQPAFSDILAALGAERLRTHMADRQPLHVPAPDGLETGGLLDRAGFEAALLSGKIPVADIQIASGYSVFDSSLPLAKEGKPHPELLRFLAERNTTFVATSVERAVPHLLTLAIEAEEALGDRVRIGAVLSNRTETGLSVHHDPESLILVQLEGSKTWHFFGDPVPGSCLTVYQRYAGAERDPGEPTHTVVMHPGDLLYVPSGLRHRCTPHGASLHLGILVTHQSGTSLLGELRTAMRERIDLFEPLVRFLGPEHIDAQAAAYKAELAALLDSIDARALLDARLAAQREKPRGG